MAQTFTTPTNPLYQPPKHSVPPATGQQPSASVQYYTVQDLPLPDNADTLDSSGGYLAYGITISYARDWGLVGQPVCGGSLQKLVDFVRIHSGQAFKIITAAAVRVGDVPEIPSLSTGSINDVLLADFPSLSAPTKLPDGSPVFVLSWQLVYGLQQMPSPTDQLDFGSLPIDTNPAAAYRLNPFSAVQNLTGPAAPVSNPPSVPVTW